MTERTFVMIKPEHIHLTDKIIADLNWQGHLEKFHYVSKVPPEVIGQHYAPHQGKPFYAHLVQAFVDKPVVIMVYQGDGIVKKIMDLAGPTDPLKAPKDTICGKYSHDSLAAAVAEHRTVHNVIHRSDSAAEAEREIKVWKAYLNP